MIPFPTPGGRYALELRFRLDEHAPASDVAMLQAMLQLRPPATGTLFAIEPDGTRALRIEGPEVGDVYAFAARLADAIRRIGDVLEDAPPGLSAEAPEQTAVPAHAPSNEAAVSRWTYEPPGEFLAPPPEARAPLAAARDWVRALRARWPRGR